jgi:acylphosphatase
MDATGSQSEDCTDDIHVTVYGRVQGVGFREGMLLVAARLRVVGWVRNRSDGTVEAVLRAEPAACEALLEWARRGPPAARVDRIARRAARAAESADVRDRFRRLESL